MGQLAKRTAEREALRVRMAGAVGPAALNPTDVAALLDKLGWPACSGTPCRKSTLRSTPPLASG
jgi:hypothetical protein